MPRGLPQLVREHLEKAKNAALAAVDSYNRPGHRFRGAQFAVLITMAWTGLLHAVFFKRQVKPWYQKRGAKGTAIRYQKVDGEPRHWELSECLKQYFGDRSPPERRNLEFIVGLRNRIEHRQLPQLDASLFGEFQASLLNFEGVLVSEFGAKHALVDQLGIALQFSQILPEERSKALRNSVRSSATSVTAFVERFRSTLPSEVLGSMRYSFSVFLVPRVANREKAADAAVRFVRVDEASPEELERLQRLNVLIRDKHIPIANLNMFKPGEVVRQVSRRIPYRMALHHHTQAWTHFQVRPVAAAVKQDRTDPRYCVYDATHRDYVYTEAWIEKLCGELADAERFTEITGQPAVPRGALT